MKKRIIALILCLAATLSVLSACAGSIDADSEYKGQQITMYLSENIYDLDPANAYINEASRNIVSLLFDTLFTFDKNGKVTPSLAKSYRTEKTKDGEYLMYIEINDGARWSDNQPVTADDVVFAWKRILNPNNSYNAAYLLFDIKNARSYNKADVSKDDVGLTADGNLLTIQFEHEMNEKDYEQFVSNLTSLALAPLREDIASKNADWAKKPGIMTASGPFKLSKIGFFKEDTRLSVQNTLFAIGNAYAVAKNYTTETVTDSEGGIHYYMHIRLHDNICWSDDKQTVNINDVLYTYNSILDPANANKNASLLFDIKNASAYNAGTLTADETVGLTGLGTEITVEFEHEMSKTDIEKFINTLTDPAFAIIKKNTKSADTSMYMASYEDINYSVKRVDKNNKVETDGFGNPVFDEAVEPDYFVGQRISSFMLERNAYYYRNAEDEEKLDVSVTPYKILVDCSLTSDEILKAYNDGIITYIADIPMELRGKVKAQTYDSYSTNVLYLNQNAEITRRYTENGETKAEKVKLFSDEYIKVRQALSMAIQRDKIAEKVVYADPATGIVPTGVFDTNSKDSLFRDKAAATSKYLTYSEKEAKDLLTKAGVVPSEYTFTVTVSSYDEVHHAIAADIVEAWKKLGFNVSLNIRGTIANNDSHKDVGSIPTDLCDDLWAEDIRNGNYDVAILDLVATTADSMSVLAPFAKQFSGQAMDMSNAEKYEFSTHPTGYDSKNYNDLIEKIFNNKNIDTRSPDLHKAEEMLIDDMPVIPILFNKSAYLLNEDQLDLNNKVLFWDSVSDMYNPVILDKVSVKDYEDYELNCAHFIYDNFNTWKERSNSYFFVNFANIDRDTFVYTNSNYYYLFKDKYNTKDYKWLPEKPLKENKTESESATEAVTEKK